MSLKFQFRLSHYDDEVNLCLRQKQTVYTYFHKYMDHNMDAINNFGVGIKVRQSAQGPY